MTSVKPCPACKGEVSGTAKKCPHCGHNLRTNIKAISTLLVLAACGGLGWWIYSSLDTPELPEGDRAAKEARDQIDLQTEAERSVVAHLTWPKDASFGWNKGVEFDPDRTTATVGATVTTKDALGGSHNVPCSVQFKRQSGRWVAKIVVINGKIVYEHR